MSFMVYPDEFWMKRCFQLAMRGAGHVSPNPLVGAVLVHDNRVIGEGFHPYYGGPHAEVQTIKNISKDDKKLIPESVLYVSLEPCCIYNKTPPCTSLLIEEGITDVRISTVDPNPAIAGQGVELLKSKGIKVTGGILEQEGRDLIRAFTANILYQQPYIILKWAQSREGYIGKNEERVFISHPTTTIWSHTLRSHADVIMTGARTVMVDNPSLTTRDAPGKSPHRAVYDPSGKLNMKYAVFNDDGKKVFYFSLKSNPSMAGNNIIPFILNDQSSHVDQMKKHLFKQQIGIVLIEGGAHLINMFKEEDAWDEAWVIQSQHTLGSGVKAPAVTGRLIEKFRSATDIVVGIRNESKMKN